MTELRLVLQAPDRLALDEPLVVLARLVDGGSTAVMTSSRLNLVEGDLEVAVRGPGEAASRATWPWPADSAPRTVELEPTAVLEGGVLLVHSTGSAPPFPVAGAYMLTARFTPGPGEEIVADPVTVVREEPVATDARQRRRALEQREVVQSLASASVLEGAADPLENLASAGSPTAALLARLAEGDAAAVRAAADAVVAEDGPVAAAAAATAVLPAGLFRGDERLTAVAEAVAPADKDGRAAAILTEQPYVPR